MVQNLKHKNKKIKIAIIGGGYDSTISKTHLRSILATNKFTIICGCFSRNRNKNVKNSDFYKIPLNKVYSSIDELIKREKENIELAVVLTPPHNRNKIYYKLAKNKIGIISEKPFEANISEAKKIYEFLKKRKTFFVSTYNYLGYPAIIELKQAIRKIGKVRNFILEMPQQSSILKSTNIKKWRKKDIGVPNLHLDLASHLVSIMIYIFNQIPQKVLGFENKNQKYKYVDNCYAWLKFKKFNGQIWFSKNAAGNKNELSIKIFGTKGGLKWKHSSPEEILFNDGVGHSFKIDRLNPKTKYLKISDLFTYSPGHPSGFLDAFINIYEQIFNIYRFKKSKYPIFLDLKQNLDIISVINSIHLSSKKNIWQKIQSKIGR